MRLNQSTHLKRMTALALALCLGLGLVWGCCPASSLQPDYGRSVTNNLAQQVVNPTAGQETAPAAGVTPGAGTNLYGKYEKTFKAEDKGAAVQLITTK
jgi:hypothetical protein